MSGKNSFQGKYIDDLDMSLHSSDMELVASYPRRTQTRYLPSTSKVQSMSSKTLTRNTSSCEPTRLSPPGTRLFQP